MKTALLLLLLLPISTAVPAERLPATRRADAIGTVEIQRLPEGVAEDPFPDPPMPVPTNLPVPIEFVRSVIAEPIVTTDVVTAPAVTLQSFPAMEDDNTAFPPDTNGAAGPSHLVTALNTALRIQDRNGAVLQTVSIRTFFDSVRKLGRVFDPHVTFDGRANRWLICAVNDQRISSTAERTQSALLLGLSRTSNPLQGWDLYRFDSPAGGWLDYPELGYDEDSIFVSVNVYALSDDKFVRANVFVISRGDPAGAYTRLEHVTNGGGTLTPTISMDAGGKRTFLVQSWNSNFQNAGFLRLYSVTAAGIVPITFVSTPVPWENSSADEFAPQLGRAEKIDCGDSRILSAVLRNGNIWATQSVYLPAGTPTRSAVNWWRLTTTGGVVGRGTIEDATSTFHYSHPSIAVNRNNDALIGFSRFSATTLPSAAYSIVSGGPSAPIVFKDGESSYYKISTSGSGKNRWGDYSGACVDPTNDLDFWTIQEYAAIPSPTYDRWGTWWARVAAPSTQSAPSRRRTVKH